LLRALANLHSNMGPVRDANEPSLIRTSDTNGGMRDNVVGVFGITVASASREFRLRVVNVLDLDLMSSVAEQMAARGTVSLPGKEVPVKRTSYQRLKTLTFDMNGRKYQAIEQNADKPSRWGQLARDGHRVVQFRDVQTGKYVAVAVDGKVKEYPR